MAKFNGFPVTDAQRDIVATAVANGDYDGAIKACNAIIAATDRPAWKTQLRKLVAFLEDGKPRFTIFMKKGNSKLPFVAFSTLPGAPFCAGAGECLNFCYSYKAHRYPSAFCRQVQNTVLLQRQQQLLSDTFMALVVRKNRKIVEDFTLRLFVDGDYKNAQQIVFFMDLLKARPLVKAYGYSKSFEQFLSLHDNGYQFPDNYVLNLSSGHKHNAAIVEKMKSLNIVRGEFIAVSGPEVAKHGNFKKYSRLAREYFAATGDTRKPFICPGKCGSCTKKEHACGSKRFNDIPVVILTH